MLASICLNLNIQQDFSVFLHPSDAVFIVVSVALRSADSGAQNRLFSSLICLLWLSAISYRAMQDAVCLVYVSVCCCSYC